MAERALRGLRRELTKTGKQPPTVPQTFANAEERDVFLATVEDFHTRLQQQRKAFFEVQREYFATKWASDADEQRAEEQSEKDGELLTHIDSQIVDAANYIRRIKEKIAKEEHQQAIAVEREAIAAEREARIARQQQQPIAHVSSVRLPKLTFPTFDGSPLEWQPFWDRFNATVHQNQAITPVDKLNYLKAQVVGDAAKMLTGLAITEANYPVAVELLKNRFGDNDVIINAHYIALTNLPAATNAKALRPILDAIEVHLNSLAALGEDVNHRQFLTTIRSKLPPAVILQMDKEKAAAEGEWSVADFRRNLRLHVTLAEQAYSSGQQINSNPVNPNSQSSRPTQRGKPAYRSSTATLITSAAAPMRPANRRTPEPNRAQRTRPEPMGPPLRSNPAPADQRNPPYPCPFCDRRNHYADECRTVQNPDERRKVLHQKKLCVNCFSPQHQLAECRRTRSCFTCKRVKQHHSSVCPERQAAAESVHLATSPEPVENRSNPEVNLLANSELSFLQTVRAQVSSTDKNRIATARGILDSAAQRSYITERLAKQLQLQFKQTKPLTVCTFASTKHSEIAGKLAEIRLRLKDGREFPMLVNIVPTIASRIQRASSTLFTQPQYRSIIRQFEDSLADELPLEPEGVSIDLLIGSDYMWDLLTMEKVALADHTFPLGSKLGWVLCGRTRITDSTTPHFALVSGEIDQPTKDIPDPQLLWNLETLGIVDPPTDPNDQIAIENFQKTVQFQDGRYHVTWPWKDPNCNPPSNYGLALGRLNSLIRRHASEPEVFQQYQQVIDDQLQKGIIEEVTDELESEPFPKGTRKHYLPHHAVVTPGRTTKLRVVYDGSAKSSRDNCSLNESLHRGPIMLDNVAAILTRFRLNKVALAADIEKAFLQVALHEADRDVTRFLWLKDPSCPTIDNNVKIYRFTRVPFGIISSPFLLSATIEHHLRQDGGEIAARILNNLYVDNLLSGTDTEADAITFYHTTKRLFTSASMNIREWISNSAVVNATLPPSDRANGPVKILGLPWDPAKDTLAIKVPIPEMTMQPPNKRIVLQYLASIFDPLGLLCPAILPAKAFLQRLWTDKFDWDDKLTPAWAKEWNGITDQLHLPDNPSIPRFVGLPAIGPPEDVSFELHVFCDASKIAYGVCVYLRIISGNITNSNLLFAKARLAPIRATLTIPRLELMAVHIGCKILNFIAASLPLQLQAKVIWSDSQCVLHWIRSEKALTVFVRNRIKVIRQNTDIQFRFLPGELNPADIASRGMPLAQLMTTETWWHGPRWLSNPEPIQSVMEFQPPAETEEIERETAAEERPRTVALLTPDNAEPKGIGAIINQEAYSTLSKLLRVTAWCQRLFRRTPHEDTAKKAARLPTPLSGSELQKAKLHWIRYIQRTSFSDIFEALEAHKAHPLVNELSLRIDKEGILRCATRLQNAKLPDATIQPILLPKKSHFTDLVIQETHKNLYHAGVSHTLAQLRMQYWIPAGRSTVRKAIRPCIKCKRYDGGPFPPPPMPELPSERVAASAPFSHIGIDFLGPVFIKVPSDPQADKKAWICLFTCMATRALHLELVPDMTADQFLLCFRRFVARRGTPHTVITDNAPQFKLVKGTLHFVWAQALSDPAVASHFSSTGIKWRFITERAPWMGGFYERLVGLVKQCLKKTLGRLRLTYAQFETTLCEVEATINSRPLAHVGSDFASGHVLTPGHFLSPNRQCGIPAPQPSDDDADFEPPRSNKASLLATWKKGEQHLQAFWKSWTRDYLLALRERNATHIKRPHCESSTSPTVGSIVLLRNEGPRGSWLLAKITELIPSADGLIRSAKVQTSTGSSFQRSITHLYPLELKDEPERTIMDPEDQPPAAITRKTTPIATPPSRIIPQRNAARVAAHRIRTMAQDDSDSDNGSPHPRSRYRTVSTAATFLAIIAIGLALLSPTHALSPMVCESSHTKVAFNIKPGPACIIRNSGQTKPLGTASALVYRRNIIRYESTAYHCRKITTKIQAWTNFAKAGFDKRSFNVDVPTTTEECRRMIQTKRCDEGTLHGDPNLAHTDNIAEPPWTSGNAWDCCRWVSAEVTNCYLSRGKVFVTFGSHFESNIGNTANCEYNAKACQLHDQSTLVWETNPVSQQEFVPWNNITGTLWRNYFISDDKELAFTWPDNPTTILLPDGTRAIVTDQGLPIAHRLLIPAKNRKITKRAAPLASATTSPTPTGTFVYNLLAPKINALELRLESYFDQTLRDILLTTCQRIEELQAVNLALASSAPTTLARKLFNDTNLMARLSGTILEVWPCLNVDTFTVRRMDPGRCFERIPVDYAIQGTKRSGYLEPRDGIIHSTSPRADCALVEEIYYQDAEDRVFLYSAVNGTITVLPGALTSHPLFNNKLLVYQDFPSVVHRPVELWTLDAIRAQPKLTDIYQAIEEHDAILDDLQRKEGAPEDSPAHAIVQNILNYTPWGWAGNLLHKFIQTWIYLCCAYVTISLAWSCITNRKAINIPRRSAAVLRARRRQPPRRHGSVQHIDWHQQPRLTQPLSIRWADTDTRITEEEAEDESVM